MADDPALIWDDETIVPRRKPPRPSQPEPTPVETAPPPGGRVTLREAHHQFGVTASTLSGWARTGKLDAVKEDGRWMVTPASVAARLSQTGGSGRRRARRPDAPGPTADGTAMLVPRDAWDKLMDQLGNLHEAGQMLADARERAAKAETESTFLRERLSDMRSERDALRIRLGEPVPTTESPGLWQRVKAVFRPGSPGGPGED